MPSATMKSRRLSSLKKESSLAFLCRPTSVFANDRTAGRQVGGFIGGGRERRFRVVHVAFHIASNLDDHLSGTKLSAVAPSSAEPACGGPDARVRADARRSYAAPQGTDRGHLLRVGSAERRPAARR